MHITSKSLIKLLYRNKRNHLINMSSHNLRNNQNSGAVYAVDYTDDLRVQTEREEKELHRIGKADK